MNAGGAPNLESLNALLSGGGLQELGAQQEARFGAFLELLVKWNERINLTAVRKREDILRRHFVECIGCAQAIPDGIHELLDFGSGAGFPGIPIAICRPEISVTLAESQAKKAAFLNEVVRRLELKSIVFAARAESIPRRFDCVTLRAVDSMNSAVQAAVGLLKANGCLAVMTTEAAAPTVLSAAGEAVRWWKTLSMSGSEQRVLLLGSLSG